MRTDQHTILLIEDNPGDVRLVQESLRSKDLKYALQHCETVDDAIRLVTKYRTGDGEIPDLILLDYNLPGGEAVSVIQAAAANPALAGTRKAVITSSVSPRDRQDALRAGADCFIYKPTDLDSFLSEVGNAILKLLSQPSKQKAVSTA